jgi:hypothetical protein
MKDKSDKKDEKDQPKKLVSENTYGLGVMAKYSWTLVLSVTAAASILAMTLFQPEKQGWRNRENFITKLRLPADWLKNKSGEFSKRNNHALEGIVPVVGASFLLGTILKRVLEVPAFWKGREDGKRANEKYAMLLDENADLARKLEQYESVANTSEQKPTVATKADEMPAGQFTADRKPSIGHVSSIQGRSASSSAVGTSV